MRNRTAAPFLAAMVLLATAGGLALLDAASDPSPRPVAQGTEAALGTGDEPTTTNLPTTLPAEVPDDPTPQVAVTLPAPPADRAQLTAELDLLLADPEFDTGSARAVVVLDEFGRPVLEENPELGLLPASTMKLVTAAAALTLHGPSGRIETPVLLDGPVTPGGTLLGDVVLVAAGDPSLSSREYRRFVYPARPASDLDEVVNLLRAAGVRRIAGDIVADPGAYADERIPSGWRDAYLWDFDGRNITGLTVDAGLEVRVSYPRSRWAGLTSQEIEDGVFIDQAPDPLLESAATLFDELAAAGFSIEGTSRVGVASTEAVVVGSIHSPRLRDLLTFMAKQSDNHIADTLFREIGAVVTGRSTWISSAESVRLLLADLEVDVTGAVLADGSGLSREDLLTGRLLAQLDLAMTNSDAGTQWAGFQAIAGEDGTLRRRLAGTIADGRFRGKTGTLNDVRALAGAVEGRDGHRYHLAILGNGGEVWRLNTLADRIVLRLTESLWCPLPDPPADVLAHCAAIAPATPSPATPAPSEAGTEGA